MLRWLHLHSTFRRLATILSLFIIIIFLHDIYLGRGSGLFRSDTCLRSVLPQREFLVTAKHCPLSPSSHEPKTPQNAKLASAISPAELLCRQPALASKGIPKLLHQSWKSTELPAKFQKWSNTCRERHPDWEWVLWTDEDNLQLIKTHFSWLEETYLSLPGNIYRADLARNLYMYMFGGVYADLDTECLRYIPDALAAYNMSFPNPVDKTSDDNQRGRIAMFGRMGSNSTFLHSIPNAWMAASPRHPFFLYPLEFARAEIKKSKQILNIGYAYPAAEELTGPIALRVSIQRYESCMKTVDEVVLLPDGLIYPYNWHTAQEASLSICSAERDTFNASQCKEMLNTQGKGSISITYWSHTHRGNGADDENIARISRVE